MTTHEWFTTTAGVKMPRLIYGTAWKKEQTADLVVQAIRAGFRGIDTACQPKHYNEALVGVALRRLQDEGIDRDRLFVQTKFTPLPGQDPQQIPYDKNAPLEVQIAQSFETSKKNLQTPYVDSLVLHSPLAPHNLLMQAWRAMEAIQEAGGARQLGISNCYHVEVLHQLFADASVKPTVVQTAFTRRRPTMRLCASGAQSMGLSIRVFGPSRQIPTFYPAKRFTRWQSLTIKPSPRFSSAISRKWVLPR
jgi:diketogulonate reductase-like aldo/keto reductase